MLAWFFESGLRCYVPYFNFKGLGEKCYLFCM